MDVKNYQRLSIEQLILGDQMKQILSDNEAGAFGGQPNDTTMNTTVSSEDIDLVKLVSELGAASKFKRVAFEKDAENMCMSTPVSSSSSKEDIINLVELKKIRDQVAMIDDQASLTQKGLDKLLGEMPNIQNLSEKNEEVVLTSEDIKAQIQKLHSENVSKANLLLRIISLSPKKYDLRSPRMKKIRGIIDGILDGSYNTSPDRYDQ